MNWRLKRQSQLSDSLRWKKKKNYYVRAANDFWARDVNLTNNLLSQRERLFPQHGQQLFAVPLFYCYRRFRCRFLATFKQRLISEASTKVWMKNRWALEIVVIHRLMWAANFARFLTLNMQVGKRRYKVSKRNEDRRSKIICSTHGKLLRRRWKTCANNRARRFGVIIIIVIK